MGGSCIWRQGGFRDGIKHTLLSCQVSVPGYGDKHYTITDMSGACMNEESKKEDQIFLSKNCVIGRICWLDAKVTLVLVIKPSLLWRG